LFKRGAFDQESVQTTSSILAAYATGVVFLLTAYAGQKFLNARGRNGVVLRSTVLGVAAGVICNLTLSDWLGVRVLGVAAAVSGAVMMGSVLWALGMVKVVWCDTWTWWMTASLHLLLVLALRFAAPQWPWWAQFIGGALLWMLSIAVLPQQRRMIVQAYQVLASRVR
jgi:peptidoglycan biosynthesis protein MviN/MurJ (putative lipid II flippase)